MRLTLTCKVCESLRHDFSPQLTNYSLCMHCGNRRSDKIHYKPLPVKIKFTQKIRTWEGPDAHEFLTTYSTLSCGHTQSFSRNLSKEKENFDSITGNKSAREYQREATFFAAETNYNCLISDAMGLGKTIEALLAFRNSPLKKCLIVVRPTNSYQWIREVVSWVLGDQSLPPFLIKDTKQYIPNIFNVYIVSMDLLGRQNKTGQFPTVERLRSLGIDFLIVDESHSFKDPSANRTLALIELVRKGNIQHKIFLSGTPIKNRASEYFTILNLIDPVNFASFHNFKRYWLDGDEKRIRRNVLDSFRDLTSKYILRREKHEVLRDLPKFTRNFIYVTIEDEWLRKSYNQKLDLFSNFLNSSEKFDQMQLLAWLNTMRKETGKAKVKFALELCEEFLENTEDDKIAIGIHHHDIRDSLYYTLNAKNLNPLKLSGEDSTFRKDDIIRQFSERQDNRVLIINMLAVGLNIQACANTMILERAWSSADEEQFEARFHRMGQTKPVTADYLMATGTIDQFYHELVADKREIFTETVESYDITKDPNALRELAQRVVSSRL